MNQPGRINPILIKITSSSRRLTWRWQIAVEQHIATRRLSQVFTEHQTFNQRSNAIIFGFVSQSPNIDIFQINILGAEVI